MPDIGATLRETRMRERIDITEVESATKIRAKYLRALENEEWDLLPGPTFVKTFLRTYGEYLGLDARLLVEEYKQRYERPGPQDLMPFGPSPRGRRQRRGPFLPPFAVVGLSVVGLLVALWFLGTQVGNDEEPGPGVESTPSGQQANKDAGRRRSRRRTGATPAPPRPRRLRLQVVPTGTVFVCLVDASGTELIAGEDLAAGAATRTFRSRRFRVTFGNGQARMRVNGRTIDVPDRPDPIGFELRPGRRPRELPANRRPTCAP